MVGAFLCCMTFVVCWEIVMFVEWFVITEAIFLMPL